MGAKIGLLASSDGDLAIVLGTLGPLGPPDPDATDALVRQLYPGWTVEPIEPSTLGDECYPGDGLVYASVTAGASILCGRDFMAPPSDTELDPVGRRRVVHVGMHSVSGWFSFSLWERGELVRTLDLSPEGVGADTGARLEVELPFWAGEHPGGAASPLPFHPASLAEEVLRTLCGFTIEGEPRPVDPDDIQLLGYRVADTSP